jgi:N6-adenosine-specific RNA methylase IME4
MDFKLNVSESQRLGELEIVIEKGMGTFVDVGTALLEIRDRDLWKQGYPDFDAYCKERWGIAKSLAHYTIAASSITANLSTIVDTLPTNESQVRPLAKLEPEQQIIAWDRSVNLSGGNVPTAKVVTGVVKEMLAEDAPETPTMEGKYRIIYADPPWTYEEHGVTEDANYGSVKHHYRTMSIDDICALPVEEIAEDDAVLFIWVTSPKLNQVWDIIDAWGFEYKTSFVWDKVKHNFGYYNSVRHEFLLICGRGSSTPDVKELYDSVQTIERSDVHSEKPEEFRDIIDHIYPTGNRVELFARDTHEGWDVWGDEV